MRVAIVHELLTMRGGAERMLRVVAEMFPDAPIYTLLYDEEKLGDWFPRERVRTSSVQNLARLSSFFTRRINHHLFLKQFPRAVEAWDFSGYDLVISFSSAFAHGVKTTPQTKHLCYVHSPARYLWDRTFDVIDRANPIARWWLKRTFHSLREWDALAGSSRGDLLLAASKAVQRRIELYWRRPSNVVYPPVDDEWFRQCASLHEQMEHPTYYLIVSSLVPYKRIELAIHACNKLARCLKIIGEGPDRKRLERIAGQTIEFYGYRANDELRDLCGNAQAFIFPGDEDFGIAPLEAMACGTPVIAYRGGGALETVAEGGTGMFFDEPTSDSLADALQKFENATFDPEVCRKRAEEFSQKRFTDDLRRAVEQVMASTLSQP